MIPVELVSHSVMNKIEPLEQCSLIKVTIFQLTITREKINKLRSKIMKVTVIF